MLEAETVTCCPDAYFCPRGGETECPRHGGFDVCCDRPGEHVPVDRQEWHAAQERLERALLDDLARGGRLYRGKDPVPC